MDGSVRAVRAEDLQGRRASLLTDPEGGVLADLIALPALQDRLEEGDHEGRGVMDAGRGDEVLLELLVAGGGEELADERRGFPRPAPLPARRGAGP